jgi:DNA polymerase, archaea type
MTVYKFALTLGHTLAIGIRCLVPKKMPIDLAESLGMTFRDDKNKPVALPISGWLSLESGAFKRIYSSGRNESITDGLGYLQTLNQQGYGVYWLPHHGTGFKAKDISHGTALFHESDRASLPEQQAVIDRITTEFGEPTVVVRTRKSLHAYWACSESIPVDVLGICQRRWLQFSECDDSSLADPGQLMRLPGFDHIRWNPETEQLEKVPCKLIHLSDVAYSLEQFDGVLPALDIERWAKKSLEIEIKDCTPTDMRSFAPFLTGFNPDGRNGWITAKCPAHGGNSDDSLHIDPTSGGFVCHAGCSSAAVYGASKSVAIANGYRLPSINASIASCSEEMETDSIHKEIETALSDIALDSVFPESLASRLKTLAVTFNQPEALIIVLFISVVSSLIKPATRITISKSSNFRQPATIWAACIGQSDDGKSPILDNLVSPLNALQSEAFKEFKRKKEEYELNLDDWKALSKEERRGKERPVQPFMRQYLVSDFTTEALVNILVNQHDCGILAHSDELVTLLGNFDKYRKSGSDRSWMLTTYDGKGATVNRKTEDPVVVTNSNIGIIGSIQPSVLKDQMGDFSKVDGFWPRFIYVCMMASKMPLIDWKSDGETGLYDLLLKTYKQIIEFPAAEYTLSIRCQAIWDEWHVLTEDRRFDECHPSLNAIYRKARARAARVALVLHCLYAALENQEPDKEIQPDTLQTAIAIAKFGIDQILSIYGDFGLGSNPELRRIAKFIQKFKDSGFIKTTDVVRWWSPKPKPDANKAREFMALLVNLGYAINNGASGKDYKIQVKNRGANGAKPSELLIKSDSTEKVYGAKSGAEIKQCGAKIESVDQPFIQDPAAQTQEHDDGFQVLHHIDGANAPLFTPQLERLEPLQDKDSKNLSTICTTFSIERIDEQGDQHTESASKPYNPRDSISTSEGQITVDLERLDLEYVPSVSIPEWAPKTTLKPYEQLSKLYIDIETTGLDEVRDRITMIGLMDATGKKTILTDPDEKAILRELIEFLRANKPDCLIGHNLFNFDLPFVVERCKRKGIAQPFRLGRKPQRISSSSVHGKSIEFIPVYWAGVNILDTYQQIAVWDKQAARLSSYGLKPSTIALGLRDEKRLELSNDEIQHCWESGDLKTLQQYLNYDLEDTQLLADFLLPVVWYQMAYVPGLSFQELAIASPALKAQKIHQALLPTINPKADEPLKYEGGKVDLLAPGLHGNVAKIDVSSLYPSVMLRYGVCSRKDFEHRFLSVMSYMVQERLRLKELARQGNTSASFQEKALKILINGSYGFLGTGGYSFNDYGAAALVTAYGRKILNRMMDVVSSCDAKLIEVDTDGILFSHSNAQTVYELVQEALPDGICIELELENCGLYVPKAKSYVIVHPNGKTTVKGLFRKRDRYPLEREFPVEFLRLYFTESPDTATVYYKSIRDSILNRSIGVEQLTITRKIGAAEKKLVELGLGKAGDRVSFWYTEQRRIHSKSSRPLDSKAIPTQAEPYWVEHYLKWLEETLQSITGESLTPLSLVQSEAQLTLFGEDIAA